MNSFNEFKLLEATTFFCTVIICHFKKVVFDFMTLICSIEWIKIFSQVIPTSTQVLTAFIFIIIAVSLAALLSVIIVTIIRLFIQSSSAIERVTPTCAAQHATETLKKEIEDSDANIESEITSAHDASSTSIESHPDQTQIIYSSCSYQPAQSESLGFESLEVPPTVQGNNLDGAEELQVESPSNSSLSTLFNEEDDAAHSGPTVTLNSHQDLPEIESSLEDEQAAVHSNGTPSVPIPTVIPAHPAETAEIDVDLDSESSYYTDSASLSEGASSSDESDWSVNVHADPLEWSETPSILTPSSEGSNQGPNFDESAFELQVVGETSGEDQPSSTPNDHLDSDVTLATLGNTPTLNFRVKLNRQQVQQAILPDFLPYPTLFQKNRQLRQLRGGQCEKDQRLQRESLEKALMSARTHAAEVNDLKAEVKDLESWLGAEQGFRIRVVELEEEKADLISRQQLEIQNVSQERDSALGKVNEKDLDINRLTKGHRAALRKMKEKDVSIESLSEELQVAEITIHQQRSSIYTLSEEIDSASERVKERDLSIERLCNEKLSAEEKVREKDSVIERLTLELELISETVRERDLSIEKLSKKLLSAGERIAEKDLSIENLSEDKLSADARVKELELDIESASKGRDLAEEEVKQKSSAIESVCRERDSLSEELKQKGLEIQNLGQKLELAERASEEKDLNHKEECERITRQATEESAKVLQLSCANERAQEDLRASQMALEEAKNLANSIFSAAQVEVQALQHQLAVSQQELDACRGEFQLHLHNLQQSPSPSVSPSQYQSQPLSQSQAQTQTQTQSQAQSHSQSHSQSQAQAQAHAQAQAQAQSHAQPPVPPPAQVQPLQPQFPQVVNKPQVVGPRSFPRTKVARSFSEPRFWDMTPSDLSWRRQPLEKGNPIIKRIRRDSIARDRRTHHSLLTHIGKFHDKTAKQPILKFKQNKNGCLSALWKYCPQQYYQNYSQQSHQQDQYQQQPSSHSQTAPPSHQNLSQTQDTITRVGRQFEIQENEPRGQRSMEELIADRRRLAEAEFARQEEEERNGNYRHHQEEEEEDQEEEEEGAPAQGQVVVSRGGRCFEIQENGPTGQRSMEELMADRRRLAEAEFARQEEEERNGIYRHYDEEEEEEEEY